MNACISNNKTKLNRLLCIFLVVAMLFAAWHVTSHEIDISGEVTSHEECQVCRLGHAPIIDLPTLTWFVPLLLLSLILLIPTVLRTNQSHRYILGARAPPFI